MSTETVKTVAIAQVVASFPLPEPFLEDIDYELWGQNAKADVYSATQMCDYALKVSDAEHTRAERAEAALRWLEKLFERKWNGVIDSGSRFDWSLRGDWRHYIQHLESETFADAVARAIVEGEGR